MDIWLTPFFVHMVYECLPAGESHSKKKIEKAEAWIATNAINNHEDLSKGSEKKLAQFYT